MLDEIGGDDGRTDWFVCSASSSASPTAATRRRSGSLRSLYEGDSDDELDEHRPVPRGPVVALRPFVVRSQALETAPARAGALAAPPRGRARPWVATFLTLSSVMIRPRHGAHAPPPRRKVVEEGVDGGLRGAPSARRRGGRGRRGARRRRPSQNRACSARRQHAERGEHEARDVDGRGTCTAALTNASIGSAGSGGGASAAAAAASAGAPRLAPAAATRSAACQSVRGAARGGGRSRGGWRR